jgi:hypothetical protein
MEFVCLLRENNAPQGVFVDKVIVENTFVVSVCQQSSGIPTVVRFQV